MRRPARRSCLARSWWGAVRASRRLSFAMRGPTRSHARMPSRRASPSAAAPARAWPSRARARAGAPSTSPSASPPAARRATSACPSRRTRPRAPPPLLPSVPPTRPPSLRRRRSQSCSVRVRLRLRLRLRVALRCVARCLRFAVALLAVGRWAALACRFVGLLSLMRRLWQVAASSREHPPHATRAPCSSPPPPSLPPADCQPGTRLVGVSGEGLVVCEACAGGTVSGTVNATECVACQVRSRPPRNRRKRERGVWWARCLLLLWGRGRGVRGRGAARALLRWPLRPTSPPSPPPRFAWVARAFARRARRPLRAVPGASRARRARTRPRRALRRACRVRSARRSPWAGRRRARRARWGSTRRSRRWGRAWRAPRAPTGRPSARPRVRRAPRGPSRTGAGRRRACRAPRGPSPRRRGPCSARRAPPAPMARLSGLAALLPTPTPSPFPPHPLPCCGRRCVGGGVTGMPLLSAALPPPPSPSSGLCVLLRRPVTRGGARRCRASRADACIVAPVGTYAPAWGMTAPLACPAGADLCCPVGCGPRQARRAVAGGHCGDRALGARSSCGVASVARDVGSARGCGLVAAARLPARR